MNNPGMSPKAWERFHKLLAQLNLKYGAKITKSQSQRNESTVASEAANELSFSDQHKAVDKHVDAGGEIVHTVGVQTGMNADVTPLI